MHDPGHGRFSSGFPPDPKRKRTAPCPEPSARRTSTHAHGTPTTPRELRESEPEPAGPVKSAGRADRFAFVETLKRRGGPVHVHPERRATLACRSRPGPCRAVPCAAQALQATTHATTAVSGPAGRQGPGPIRSPARPPAVSRSTAPWPAGQVSGVRWCARAAACHARQVTPTRAVAFARA